MVILKLFAECRSLSDSPLVFWAAHFLRRRSEEAQAAFVGKGPTTCYQSPTDAKQITLFKDRAEKTADEKLVALLVTVTPLVVTFIATSFLLVVFVRLRVSSTLPDNGTGSFLSSLLGTAVLPQPGPRVAPSHGLQESDADAAIEDIARTIDSPATVCVVCLEENTSKALELPCTHTFHASCLKECTLVAALVPMSSSGAHLGGT